MMKKYVATAMFAGALGMAGTAQADNTGCGLGTVLFAGQTGMGQDILAVTTNQISWNQHFGSTSGTLGCESGQTITADAAQFMSENMDQVAHDASNGGGEALATLASLLEIDEADQEAFFSHAQENFGEIFPSADVTAGEALENLEATMAAHDTLSRYTA